MLLLDFCGLFLHISLKVFSQHDDFLSAFWYLSFKCGWLVSNVAGTKELFPRTVVVVSFFRKLRMQFLFRISKEDQAKLDTTVVMGMLQTFGTPDISSDIKLFRVGKLDETN